MSETPFPAPAPTAGRGRGTSPAGALDTGGEHRRVKRVVGTDRVAVVLMVAIPAVLVIGLVWLPAIASVVLSFANWDGIGGLGAIKWIGDQNYVDIFTNYPPFKPAIEHNLLWLAVLFLVATPAGIFVAVLVDKDIKGSRFYQTAFYLPVVLSLALIGFIWQLIYSSNQGLLNAVLGTHVDWYGNPSVNIWAVLVAAAWRHIGYIMLLYLAGLKGVDLALREAAEMDGANQVQTFFRIIFPVMKPINIIVVVITVIESLRAFDLVWVINQGRNGLELISALVVQNIAGEASRVGFGSALATIMLLIALVFIVIYLANIMKEDDA